jgi:hypothetical protein
MANPPEFQRRFTTSDAVTNLLRAGHITQTCSQWFFARLASQGLAGKYVAIARVIMPFHSMFAKLRTSAVGAAMVVTALPGLLQAQMTQRQRRRSSTSS